MPDPTAVPFTHPKTRGLFSHETALICLGVTTFLGLLIRTRSFGGIVLEVASYTLGLLGVAILLDATKPTLLRLRLALTGAFVLGFYFAVARMAPLFAMPLQDDLLYSIDFWIMGATPAQFCSCFATARLTDLMSVCYLSFLAYLFVAYAHALFQPGKYALRCLGPVQMGYAVGLAFYLATPAVGPGLAFPKLFAEPLSGGLAFRFNETVVGWGSSVYDVFPTLHILIAALLLHHDWRFCRKRFWIMCAPACGLVLSTVYLRYHYGVDLAAGFLIFLLFVLLPKVMR